MKKSCIMSSILDKGKRAQLTLKYKFYFHEIKFQEEFTADGYSTPGQS